jgi:hypothetical protein
MTMFLKRISLFILLLSFAGCNSTPPPADNQKEEKKEEDNQAEKVRNKSQNMKDLQRDKLEEKNEKDEDDKK